MHLFMRHVFILWAGSIFFILCCCIWAMCFTLIKFQLVIYFSEILILQWLVCFGLQYVSKSYMFVSNFIHVFILISSFDHAAFIMFKCHSQLIVLFQQSVQNLVRMVADVFKCDCSVSAICSKPCQNGG